MKESKYVVYTEVDFNINGLERSMQTLKENSKAIKDIIQDLKEKIKKADEDYGKAFTSHGKKDKRTKEAKAQLDDLRKQLKANQIAQRAIDAQITKGIEKLNLFEDALLNADKMGTKTLISVSNAMKNALRNINDMSEEGQKKIKALAVGYQQTQAEIQSRMLGITNASKHVKLADFDKKAVPELKAIITVYEQFGATLAHNQKELQRMGENATNAKIQMAKVTGELRDVSMMQDHEHYDQAIKFWQGITKYAGATEQQIKKANQQIEELYTKRAEKDIATIDNAGNQSSQDIQLAAKGLQEYLNVAQNLTEEERKRYLNKIEDAKLFLKEQEEMGKVIAMQRQLGEEFEKVGQLSNSALAAQNKYWEEELTKSDLADERIEQYRQALEAVRAEQQRRITDTGEGALSSSVTGKSLKDLEEMKQQIEQYRKTIAATNTDKLDEIQKKLEAIKQAEIDINHVNATQQVEEGQFAGMSMSQLQEVIRNYEQMGIAIAHDQEELKVMGENATNAKIQLAQTTGELARFEEMQDRSSLEQAIKFWQGITNYAGATVDQVIDAEDEIDRLRLKMKDYDREVINNPRAESNQAIQTSIKGLQEYLNVTEGVTAAEREQITAEIEKAKLYLKEQEEMGKVISMLTQLGESNHDIAQLSNSALEEQRKFWDAELSKWNLTQEQIEQYSNALQRVKYEMESRAFKSGESILGTSAVGKSLAELREMRQKLELYKQTISSTNTSKLDEIRQKMKEITEEEERIEGKAVDVNQVLANIKTASMDDLQKAAAKLKQELQNTERGTQDYIIKSRDLQIVEDRIRNINDEWGQTSTTIDRVLSQFGQQLISFFGITKLFGLFHQGIGQIVALSDEMTNVAKVTNMTDEEINELTNSLMGLDTRTAREELMKLAEQGGKLGIAMDYGTQGLVQFASEGQKMLTTLGEEAGGAEVVTQILKINDLINKGGESVNTALNKIGSGILNVGNNSKASYKDITEFVTRLGSTGSVANLTMEQIIALGGTFSALGSSMETSSTMMIRLLMGLQTKTEQVARAAGADVAEVIALMNGEEGPRTFEALNLILEATGNNAQKIQDVLKAVGGKIGAQMTKELSVLSTNMGTLNYQLNLASDGYRDATLLTQEFERANDNLAGNLQRLSHYWEEIFVNPQMVGALSDAVKAFYNLNRMLVETKGLLPGLMAAMGLFAGLLTSVTAKTTVLGRTVTRMIEHLIIIRKNFLAAIPAMLGFRNASEASRKSLEALKASGFSNWLTLILTLLGALVGWMIQLARQTTSAAKATSELETQLNQELATVNSLFDALKKENIEKEEKARLISVINSRYGKYLDNMLTETSSANELALAHKRVAAALREEMMIKGQQAVLDKVAQDSGEKMAEGLDRIQKSIASYATRFRNGAKNGFSFTMDQNDAMNKFLDVVEKSVQELFEKGGEVSVGDVEDAVKARFRKQMKKMGDEGNQLLALSSSLFQNINTGTNRYIEGLINQYDAAKVAGVFMSRQAEQSDKDNAKVVEALGNTINNQLMNHTGELSEDELELVIKRIKEYDSKTKNSKNPAIQARRKLFNSRLDGLQTKLDARRLRSGWIGKSDEDIQNLDVNYLNALKKQYNEVIKASNPEKKMNELFPGLGIPDELSNNPEALRKEMQERIDKILAEFARRGLNTAGNYTPKTSTTDKDKWKNDTRESLAAAVASVDNYFEVLETEIRKKGNELGLSDEEVERQVFNNEQEHLNARVKLRKNFLGMIGGLTQQEMKLYGVEEQAVKMINANLKKLDKEREANTLNMNKDLNTIEKNLAERMKKIRQLLLDDEPIEKAMEEFRSSMASLGMVIGDLEEVSDTQNRNIATARLAQLVEWGRNAYALTVEQLKAAMQQEDNIYHDWLMSLGEDQDQVLLAMLKKLQNYHDEVLKAQKPILDHIERYVNIKWKATGNEQSYAIQEKQLDEETNTARTFSEYVGGSGKMTMDAELNLINMKMEAKKKYIDMLNEEVQATIALRKAEEEKLRVELQERWNRGEDPEDLEDRLRLAQQLTQQTIEAGNVALTNAYKDMNALQDEYLNKSIEVIHRFDTYYKSAADEIGEAAEKFGEGIFGSKEQRQEAARDVIRTILTTTRDILKAYLVDVNTYSLMQQQKSAIADVYAAKERVRKVREAGDQAALTEANIALYSAEATAKAASKSLWIGLAIGAAITVALNALLGAAMGKVNAAKAQLGSSESGNAGKFVTGMLTYAQGNIDSFPAAYPNNRNQYNVKGKNGRSYRARYEEQLQTGIYGGGAHFGIFSEEMPEAIIDGRTTRKLVVDYPALWDAIVTISKTGSLGKRNQAYGMPAFADGNINTNGAIANEELQNEENGNTINAEYIPQLVSILARLTAQLDRGLGVNMWGDNGLWKSMKDAEYFAKKNGL